MIANRMNRLDLQRLTEVLAQPDPPDLRGRGVRWTHAGDPQRRQTVLLPLLIRWAQHRCLHVDPEPATAPARPGCARSTCALTFRRRADSAA